MKVIKTQVPFFINTVIHHDKIKKDLLKEIANTNGKSMKDESQKISNTDWQLSAEANRPYMNIAGVIMKNVLESVRVTAKLEQNLYLGNYWFQQYKKGDYHKWHTHTDANFSSVYYVDLPNGSAFTTFCFMGKEFEIEVKEGEVLTSYGCFQHMSKPTKNKKTVIVFNSRLQNE
jgi:hypothetical protein